MTTSRVLVTGAAGLIGSETVKKLFNVGYDVVGLYRQPSDRSLPWKMCFGDLTKSSLGSILNRHKIDAIVHAASVLPGANITDSVASDQNKIIDENVIRFSESKGIKLVYFSGTSVYKSGDFTCDENDEVYSDNRYIAGKIRSETLIEQVLKKYVILRVSAPYGYSQKSLTVLNIFIQNALKNLPLVYYGSGSREQDFTAVEDVADAVVSSLKASEVNGIFNIASGRYVQMRDLAQIVIRSIPLCESTVEASGLPDNQENSKARYSIQKAGAILNWEPKISLEEGILNWVSSIIKCA